jgi:hypothetical protein
LGKLVACPPRIAVEEERHDELPDNISPHGLVVILSVPRRLEVDAPDYLTALRGFTKGPGGLSAHGDLFLDAESHLYGVARPNAFGSNGGMIFEVSTNPIEKPAALPTCQFTPSSQTETLPWDFDGMQGFSETFVYNVPPGDTGFCWVPKASCTASWLSNVTPAQGYEVGSGENYITFYTAENTSTAPRAAQIRPGSGFVLTLKQSGYPAISCQYIPSSETIQIGSGGASVNYVSADIRRDLGAARL